MNGRASIVTALLAAGANLEAKEWVRGVWCVPLRVYPSTPIPLATYIVYAPSARVLQGGRTPLYVAQSYGHAEVVALLQAAAAAPARR